MHLAVLLATLLSLASLLSPRLHCAPCESDACCRSRVACGTTAEAPVRDSICREVSCCGASSAAIAGGEAGCARSGTPLLLASSGGGCCRPMLLPAMASTGEPGGRRLAAGDEPPHPIASAGSRVDLSRARPAAMAMRRGGPLPPDPSRRRATLGIWTI